MASKLNPDASKRGNIIASDAIRRNLRLGKIRSQHLSIRAMSRKVEAVVEEAANEGKRKPRLHLPLGVNVEVSNGREPGLINLLFHHQMESYSSIHKIGNPEAKKKP